MYGQKILAANARLDAAPTFVALLKPLMCLSVPSSFGQLVVGNIVGAAFGGVNGG
jgi:hypothetical protein